MQNGDGGVFGGLLVASLLKASDVGFVSALFKVYERDFDLTPSSLGQVWLAQSLSMKFAGLVWSPRIDSENDPKKFLVIMVVGLGFTSLLASQASGFWDLAVLRFVAGCFNASLRPLTGSVVAQIGSENRGQLFSKVSIMEATGKLLGASICAKFSDDWRILLASFGSLCIGIGAIFKIILPEKKTLVKTPGKKNKQEEMQEKESSLKTILSMKSFHLIVLHGLFSSFPFNGFSFLMMWFQIGGVDSAQAGIFGNAMHMGTIVGQFLSGFVGDYFAALDPLHGRIYAAQSAAFLRIPIAAYVFLGVGVENLPLAAFALFVMGCVIPWIGTGMTKPILTELIPKAAAGRLLSIHFALQSVFSIGSGLVVGALAEEMYGYDIEKVKTREKACKIETERRALLAGENSSNFWESLFDMEWWISTTEPLKSCVDEENHYALGRAILWNTVLPWIISAIFISCLHFTFPKDRARAKALKQ